MMPTPAQLEHMPWHARTRLARRLGVHESRLPQHLSKHHKLKAAWRRNKALAAARIAADVQPDHDIARCSLCGAWTVGECRTNHRWQP